MAAGSGLAAPALDPVEFRRCMRAVPGAVAIITCGEEGTRTGLTATAVCSLSDSPPMLLVCVNESASAHPVICGSQRFAVNILSADHLTLASRFAGRDGAEGEARFAGAAWVRSATGASFLSEAIVSFDCVLEAQHHHGSHSIFVGRIVAARSRDGESPLLYLGGRFGTFVEPPEFQ
jgi:flavin reductase